jgi:hypothetical protein
MTEQLCLQMLTQEFCNLLEYWDKREGKGHTCRWPLDLMGVSRGMMTCCPLLSSGTAARFSAIVFPGAFQTCTQSDQQ